MKIPSLKKKGFTLLEMVITISIIAILLGIGAKAWIDVATRKSVEGAATQIVSVFDTARTYSMSSKNAQTYGVNIASSSVTLFGGSAFDPADPNNQSLSMDGVRVATTSLSVGTTSIIFSRFLGQPSATGTFYVVSLKDASVVKIIQIDSSGLAKTL